MGRESTGGVGAGRTIKRNVGDVRIESILSLLANPTAAIFAGAGRNAITESRAALHEFLSPVNFSRNNLEVSLAPGPLFFDFGSSAVGQESSAESLEPDSLSEIAFLSGSGLSSLDFRNSDRLTQFATGDGPGLGLNPGDPDQNEKFHGWRV